MATITGTMNPGENWIETISEMLSRIAKDKPIRITISEVDPASPVPTIDEYRQMVAEARRNAPPCPWTSTADALRDLRAGEDS